MPAQRTTGVLVFAILHLLFGVSGIVGIVASEIMLLSAADDAQNPLIAAVPRDAIYFLLTLFDLALWIVLVLAGLALLRMQPKARILSLFYALFAILLTAGKAWFIYVPLAASAIDPSGQDVGMIVGVIAGVVMFALGSIYPLANLVYFSLPSVKQRFELARSDG